ncbi:MAG: hypothetical protein J6V72_02810, partial [Kiritimatiellae bacterium]|nr:hypothetical protein [Kiritimatiellia bacterium]
AFFAVVKAWVGGVGSYGEYLDFALAAIFLAPGVGCLVYFVGDFLSRRGVGGLDGGKWSLCGLVVAGAAVFQSEFFDWAQTCDSFGPVCGVGLLCQLHAAMRVSLLWLAGHCIARYDFGLRRDGVPRDWLAMDEHARWTSVGACCPFAVAVLFALVDLLCYGLRFKIWVAVGDAFYSSGVFLCLLSYLRRAVFRMVVRPRVAKAFDFAKFRTKAPVSIWGRAFTVPEYSAAAIFAGSEMLVFFVFPQLFKSWSLLVVPICALVGLLALVLVLCLDGNHLASMLREQWRTETKEFLLSRHAWYAKVYRKALRDCVVAHFTAAEKRSWKDVGTIREIAEGMRRSLNLRFCEDGAMKYLSRFDIVDRKSAAGKYAGRLFDDKCGADIPGLRLKDPADMTDEQLLSSLAEAEKWHDADSIRPRAEDVDSCVSDLLALAEGADLCPTCSFLLEFRRGKSVRVYELEIDEKRRAALSWKDDSTSDLVTRFGLDEEKMFDVLSEGAA